MLFRSLITLILSAMRRGRDIAFEDSISEDWSRDLETVEVRLNRKPARYAALLVLAMILAVAGRITQLNLVRGKLYAARAESNANRVDHILAPRGLILDRHGAVVAENRSVFRALLKVDEYSKHPELQEKTLTAIRDIFGMPPEEIRSLIREAAKEELAEPIVLGDDLSQEQLVRVKAIELPTIAVADVFMRHYPDGEAFSALLGYVSLPTAKDLASRPSLASQDLVGKAGVEAYYDEILQGIPGKYVKVRNAKGQIVHEEEQAKPKIGKPLTLTVDGEFQKYFAGRLKQGLDSLGRTSGAGLAMDPRTGEILALVSLPTYNNNILSSPGNREAKTEILTSEQKPLFNRIVGGNYNPASTMKPLVAAAGLAEGVIVPTTHVYSPGYLDVHNPYNPSKPSRFVDWRFQGDMDMYLGIAFSSNVYFYSVGGGAGSIKGLGITKLKAWWEKFGFGKPTGIDLPGEAKGFLPDPKWKEEAHGRPWLLGDTYNVSIGQGDLSVTPIQLLNYISAVANGGTLYRPHASKTVEPEKTGDLTQYGRELLEVRKGMRQTVVHPRGSAYLMHDLPFYIGGKTGSAQILNNTKENAFFVGFASRDSSGAATEDIQAPEIAILILIEDSKQGSLNAVPVAKDALGWYYEHRMK